MSEKRFDLRILPLFENDLKTVCRILAPLVMSKAGVLLIFIQHMVYYQR